MASGGQSQQSSNSQLDPEIKAKFLQNYAGAQDVAQGLKAREFTGFTPEQQAGFDITKQVATSQPGRQLVNQGVEATNQAGLTPQSISNFLNPYTQNVVDTTMSDIARQRDIAQNANTADVAARSAFGNTRRALQAVAVEDPYARAMASEAAKLRESGYNTAADLAAKASGIDLSKGAQLAQLGTTAQNLGFQSGEQLANVGAQQQALTQAQIDAVRNLPLEQQQILNQAISLNPAGGSGTQTASSGGSKQSLWGWLGLG